MSVYQVFQWSVPEPEADACGRAVEAIGEHIRTAHPTARSFRTYRQVIGPLPLRTYICLLEYESFAAFEADPETPSCSEAWAPVFAAAEPGSVTVSMWSDPQRGAWFER